MGLIQTSIEKNKTKQNPINKNREKKEKKERQKEKDNLYLSFASRL